MGKPMSNAERKRKYREKLTDDKHEEIKKADRERKALKRATEKLAMDQLTKRREHDRERQRKHRESKKMNKPTVINMPFKSRQSKARAVTKTRRANNSKEFFQSHLHRKSKLEIHKITIQQMHSQKKQLIL